MPTVISVEHLSKSYRLGQIGTGTFSRDLEVWWAKVRGKPNPLLRIGDPSPIPSPAGEGRRGGVDTIWALKDINFTVEQGEVLGIIGKNGAGKSTLLKILSRVTAPTSGKIKVKGRIASLLEVGTGFHPELTGRENIYLNGAILGMNRKEIDRKFDEIVDFAEVEKFIDTPVKRYSSGMYVRLAFAVAAHLDPEILVVDEVLAVGDAEFQKKCLGKMGDVAKEGRTVLFVSHNMGAIRNLCSKSLLLVNGCKDLYEFTEIVIEKYLDIGHSAPNGIWIKNDEKISEISIHEVSIKSNLNVVSGNIDSKSSFKIRIVLHAQKNNINAQIHIRVTNQMGIAVFTISNADHCNNYTGIKKERSIFDVTIPANFLMPGSYNAIIAVLSPNVTIFDSVEISFTIEDVGNHGTIQRDNRLGVITPIFMWEAVDGTAE